MSKPMNKCHIFSEYPKQKHPFNPLRPRQNGRHFADDTLNRIFLNENVRILIKISLKFAPKGPINNIPALFQIMAWRRPGDKPLSEPMTVSLLTHICITRPQCVKEQFSVWVYVTACVHSWSTIMCLDSQLSGEKIIYMI